MGISLIKKSLVFSNVNNGSEHGPSDSTSTTSDVSYDLGGGKYDEGKVSDKKNKLNLDTKEIVKCLDNFVIGQYEAKKAVAVALRNRFRRMHVEKEFQKEITPNNILMIGPTGVGKTEIARRLAKLVKSPFLKVEATKFTEVGYVGRDVEQIIRDLVDIAINQIRDEMRSIIKDDVEATVEEIILDVLVSKEATEEVREKFRDKLKEGILDNSKIEIEITENKQLDINNPSQAGSGAMGINDILGKAFSQKKRKKMKIKDAKHVLFLSESDKLMDQEEINRIALKRVEENGIVFLDEIDKLCGKSRESRAGDVSREGVQRDLLPLIEGTVISTKYGTVRTDHILFIASGAFHLAKPSDLLPELQGRMPIRVELKPLTKEDFVKILTHTKFNIPTQYQKMLEVDNVRLSFSDCAVARIADLAVHFNETVENIGARRLQSIIEKVLSDVSFEAPYDDLKDILINKDYVNDRFKDISESVDFSGFIL